MSAWDEVAGCYGEGEPVFAAFAERLVERAAIAPGERVVDLGCGNGLGLAHAAVATGTRCSVGLDASEAMLAACRRRAVDVPVVRADVRALPLRDGVVDVALASSVFQFVGYAVDVLREWRRVLVPGGRLLFSIPAGVSDGDVNTTLMTEYFPRLPADVRRRLAGDGPPPPAPDLAEVSRAAGFGEAAVTVEEFPVVVESRQRWWDVQWTHGFRAFLREFDDATLEDMRTRAFELLEPSVAPGGEVSGTQRFAFCVARR